MQSVTDPRATNEHELSGERRPHVLPNAVEVDPSAQGVVAAHKALQARFFWLLLALGAALVLLFLFSLALGSVSIPLPAVGEILLNGGHEQTAWANIVWKVRLPKALTALLAGASLAIAGLQMQTLFRNPLAGPYVLGISSGASLGVALVLLGTEGASSVIYSLSIVHGIGTAISAVTGAGMVLLLVLWAARYVDNSLTLLLLGLMFGYAAGALVTVLLHFARAEAIQAYVQWTFGTFGDVTWSQLGVMSPLLGIGILLTLLCIKSLNALLLGEQYAQSMGVNIRRSRYTIIAATAILAGGVTAFCGPIAFLGIAVPHLARALFGTAEHQVLFPATLLLGALLALLADILAQMPGHTMTLPLNAVMALIGAPVVTWVILRRRTVQSSL